MKKLLLLSFALLALTATAASAQIFLNADECQSAGRTADILPPTCLSNLAAQNRTFVSSYIAPAGVGNFVGATTVLKVVVAGGTVAPWWQMSTGQCSFGRYDQGSAGGAGLSACLEAFVGNQAGGNNIVSGDGGPDRVTIVSDWVQDVGSQLTPGSEYYAQFHTLKAIKSTGTGNCAGCELAACIVLDEVQLYQGGIPPGQTFFLRNPSGAPTYVTWQGGSVGGAGCPNATPARNKTWGEVKSLYR
jgi:hypothetical protein